MSGKAVIIGASAGGLQAFITILEKLPASFPWPIFLVQHQLPTESTFLTDHLMKICALPVQEGIDKLPVGKGVYVAPPAYHMLLDRSGDTAFIELSSDERVNYSRPSIDLLFESAADIYAENAIGVLLTGANSDGAHGMLKIHEAGGITVAQDPNTAEVAMMPESAIELFDVDHILALEGIADFLIEQGEKDE